LALVASIAENTRAFYHLESLPDATFWIGRGFTHERRRGHFSKASPYFLARFQRLIADDPASLETEALLKINGQSVRSAEEKSSAFDQTRKSLVKGMMLGKT
jgi:hypothetical protein